MLQERLRDGATPSRPSLAPSGGRALVLSRVGSHRSRQLAEQNAVNRIFGLGTRHPIRETGVCPLGAIGQWARSRPVAAAGKGILSSDRDVVRAQVSPDCVFLYAPFSRKVREVRHSSWLVISCFGGGLSRSTGCGEGRLTWFTAGVAGHAIVAYGQ